MRRAAAVGDTAGAVPGMLALALDITIVNVALPGLITDLHAPPDEAPWMVTGLPAGVLRAADRRQRARRPGRAAQPSTHVGRRRVAAKATGLVTEHIAQASLPPVRPKRWWP